MIIEQKHKNAKTNLNVLFEDKDSHTFEIPGAGSPCKISVICGFEKHILLLFSNFGEKPVKAKGSTHDEKKMDIKEQHIRSSFIVFKNLGLCIALVLF
jgi:hypothetical protein